ncbi:MAG: transglycosylase SLT domain-containing protein [Proteobacteria bacterium]|nr:transglycosylase SLT domain-containing protein [Pseudomonadota bacterium]
MISKIITFIVLCLVPAYAYSAIYGYVDDRGIYHFTNIKPAGKQYHVVITDKNRTMGLQKNFDNSNYDTLIMRHSSLHGIDPSLVKAVMKAESNFNPYAVSPKGAQGLMQLMPDTAKLMKVENPFDPDENIKGGTKYLKFLEETFHGNLELILAAYNAGPSKVMEHKMNVPPIEETRTFIKRVKQFYNKLKYPNEG